MKANSRYFGRIQETDCCATGAVDMESTSSACGIDQRYRRARPAADRLELPFCGRPIPQSIHFPRDSAIGPCLIKPCQLAEAINGLAKGPAKAPCALVCSYATPCFGGQERACCQPCCHQCCYQCCYPTLHVAAGRLGHRSADPLGTGHSRSQRRAARYSP